MKGRNEVGYLDGVLTRDSVGRGVGDWNSSRADWPLRSPAEVATLSVKGFGRRKHCWPAVPKLCSAGSVVEPTCVDALSCSREGCVLSAWIFTRQHDDVVDVANCFILVLEACCVHTHLPCLKTQFRSTDVFHTKNADVSSDCTQAVEKNKKSSPTVASDSVLKYVCRGAARRQPCVSACATLIMSEIFP